MVPRSRLYANSLHLSLLTTVQFSAVFTSSRRIRSECDVWRFQCEKPCGFAISGSSSVKTEDAESCLLRDFNFLNTKAQPLRESYISAGRAGLGRSLGTNSTAAAAQWPRPGPGSILWPTRPTRWPANHQPLSLDGDRPMAGPGRLSSRGPARAGLNLKLKVPGLYRL